MDKYRGFYIEEPVGNNIFSYEERSNKKIFVPKLIEGTLDDVLVGNEIVFNEIMTENFPNLKTETDTQVQEAQRVSHKIIWNRITTKHIIIKTVKVKINGEF